MDCSMPGLPVIHHLPESAQVHVHYIGDAIQPSHPLMSSSPPALNLSQHDGIFKWVICFHQMTKILELQLQHVLLVNIQCWFPLRLTVLISLLFNGLSGVFSSTTVLKAYGEQCWIHDLRRRFSVKISTRLDHSEIFSGRRFTTVRKDRENFWHRHLKGDGECPPQ